MTPAEEDAVRVAQAFLEVRFGISRDEPEEKKKREEREKRLARLHKAEPLQEWLANVRSHPPSWQKKWPLKGILKEYAEQDVVSRGKGRKWWHQQERDLYIAEAVALTIASGKFRPNRGPERISPRRRKESGCSIVAAALARIKGKGRPSIREDAVVDIWKHAPATLNPKRTSKNKHPRHPK